MRIVLDLQACQTSGSRNRGIGRYSMALAKAMAEQADRHEIIVALNGAIPAAIDEICAELGDYIPRERIVVWNSPEQVRESDPRNEWRRKAAEHVREFFLASLRPDIVHVSSLFEGIDDDAVTSVKAFEGGSMDAATLYDLIPLVHRDIYLPVGTVRDWYFRKLRWLRQAECLLAISEHTRHEAIAMLDLPEERVHAISGAVDARFRKIEVREESEFLRRHGLNRPFVMYTGGIDHRKNIEGLIEAYGGLPQHIRAAHQLAVVCKVSEGDRRRLEALAAKSGLRQGDLVLTGYVTDDDLVALYNLCRLFVFPSWHEGFGLPALEAMSCGAATIAADSSSLPEVIGRRDALFDARSTEALRETMRGVLSNENFLADLRRHGIERSRLFTWKECGRRALAAFEETHAARETPRKPAVNIFPRPRLAYVSPMPPERSGIADFSAGFLPELARHYDIEIVVAQKEVTDPLIHAGGPIRSAEWFNENAGRYDRILYHFGNSSFHTHMFNLARKWPGTIVLHDFYLSGVLAHEEMAGGKAEIWARALYASHGYSGLIERKEGRNFTGTVLRFPCNLDQVEAASGFIVHSEHARRMAAEWYGENTVREWTRVPLARSMPRDADRGKARAQLGLASDEYVICSFGMQAVTKLGDRLIEAFAASRLARQERCRLVLVGDAPGDYGDQLRRLIRKQELGDRIAITGHVPIETYRTWLAAANAAVQLRTLSRGETSASVLDCMAYGLPTIINANGSMAELPADALLTLEDEFSDEALAAAMERLYEDPAESRRIGNAAARHVRQEHAPSRVAELYQEAIERYAEHSRTARLNRLSEGLLRIEAFSPPSQQDWIEVAACIAAVNPPATGTRQLLVDLSLAVRQQDGETLRPTVRTLLEDALRNPPAGWRIEPVYMDGSGRLRHARSFTLGLIGVRVNSLKDEPVDLRPGDILLDPDITSGIGQERETLNRHLRHRNVRTCLLLDEAALPADTAGTTGWENRLERAVSFVEGIVCTSPEGMHRLLERLDVMCVRRRLPLKVGHPDTQSNGDPFQTVVKGAWSGEWMPSRAENGTSGELSPGNPAMVPAEARWNGTNG
jgi:glycosyltransferase involved in cell wall biosynthesis